MDYHIMLYSDFSPYLSSQQFPEIQKQNFQDRKGYP